MKWLSHIAIKPPALVDILERCQNLFLGEADALERVLMVRLVVACSLGLLFQDLGKLRADLQPELRVDLRHDLLGICHQFVEVDQGPAIFGRLFQAFDGIPVPVLGGSEDVFGMWISLIRLCQHTPPMGREAGVGRYHLQRVAG